MESSGPSKVVASAAQAVADVFSGASICVGGFGPERNRPMTLLNALAGRPEVTDLTLIANGFPFQPLAEQRQVSKFIAAFGGSSYRRATASEEQIRAGEIAFEPCPQGILTERLRAGAAGIPAFYSPVGVDTLVAAGKERRVFDGREHILETALRPDFAFVRAQQGDAQGNLSGIGSTINFHPAMAAAGRITLAEVDEIVPVGQLAPEAVTVPGIYVQRVVLHDAAADADATREDARLVRRRDGAAEARVGLSQDRMAQRVAQLLCPGQYVNLGMGIPVQVANYISPDSGIMLHGENGILGYGPQPDAAAQRWYHYNAIGQPVSVFSGASVFSSLDAFTMGRGGHLDVVVLGGLQVSARGDLANWWAPYMAAGGMGGAMDLCTNVKELIVLMDHVTRDGSPKILNECSYPLTASQCVTRIITDLAHIEVTAGGLVLKEVAPGVSPSYVQARTEPPLAIAPDCTEMQIP